MEDIHKIARIVKDRVILLDTDLEKNGLIVSKGNDIFQLFQGMRGRHYKKLKHGGSGWSFSRENFAPRQKEYDVDIPDTVRHFFLDYLNIANK
jgi:hypothetical protein